jgi:hypothetical protein
MLQLPSRPGGFIEPRRSPRAAAWLLRKKPAGATLKVIGANGALIELRRQSGGRIVLALLSPSDRSGVPVMAWLYQ